mgnify:CR=1 FL=1
MEAAMPRLLADAKLWRVDATSRSDTLRLAAALKAAGLHARQPTPHERYRGLWLLDLDLCTGVAAGVEAIVDAARRQDFLRSSVRESGQVTDLSKVVANMIRDPVESKAISSTGGSSKRAASNKENTTATVNRPPVPLPPFVGT